MAVEFGILGPLQVVVDGVLRPCGGPRRRALLADLLVHANSVVSIDRLIDDLWGEHAPGTARNALHVHMAGLRKDLGADGPRVVVSRGSGYLLVAGADSLDLCRYQALAAEGRRASSANPAAAADRLTEALALWRGSPLEEFLSYDFAATESARLEELHAGVVEDLAQAELALARNEDAIARLQKLVVEHPLRERPRQQLMLALYRSDRQAEALAGYREFRDRMIEELGIEPGASLRDLEAAILNQDTRLGASAHATLPEVVSVGSEHASAASPRMADEAVGAERSRERKVVTVLWCGLSAASGDRPDTDDVEEQTARTERRLDAAADVVQAHGGTVEMAAGDTLLAVFGAPAAHEDDAQRAIGTALRIGDAWSGADMGAGDSGGRPRFGIATGEALVTLSPVIGGRSRVNGDVVRAAFSLYERASEGAVLIDDQSYRAGGHAFRCQVATAPGIDGNTQAAPVWLVGGTRAEPDGGDDERLPLRSIGRNEESALLASALSRTVNSRVVQLVTIVGEAGVGKSRLVADLRDSAMAGDRPITWYEGRCHAYGDGAGLSALRQIVKTHARILDSDQPAVVEAKLEKSVADDEPDAAWVRRRLRPLVGLEASPAERAESFTAWRRFLEQLAASQPAVLILEDLHWADDGLLEFVEHTVGLAQDVPLLMIATTRPDLFERNARWAGALPNTTRIDLSPLPFTDMHRLVASLLDAWSLPHRLDRLVLSRASGNPLFATEFVRLLRQRPDLASQAASSAIEPVDVPIPTNVRDMIAARIDALPPGRKRVLQDAAVVGDVFWPAALRQMSRRGDPDVETQVRELSRAGLVRAVRRSSVKDHEEYAFQHPLVRDVSYRQLPREDRAMRHEQVASWLESVKPSDTLIGQHLWEATRLRLGGATEEPHLAQLARRAAGYLLVECEGALRYGDRETAERNADRMAQLLTALPSLITSVESPLGSHAAKLFVTMGRWDDVVATLSPMEASAPPSLLRDVGVALCQLHRAEPDSAAYQHGQALLERAVAGDDNDPDAVASLAGTWKGIDDSRARLLYNRCLEIDPTDPYALGNALEYDVCSDGERAIDKHRDKLVAALKRCREETHDGVNLPWAWYDLGKLAALLGMSDEAITSYAKAVQLTSSDHPIVTSMASLARLAAGCEHCEGFRWGHRFLSIARTGLFRPAGAPTSSITSSPLGPLPGGARVVMLAGGTDASADEWVDAHDDVVLEAFDHFDGVILSGGTSNGIARLAGAIGSRRGSKVKTVGYLPRRIAADATVDVRYDELRRTEGSAFSIEESLLAWADVVESGASSRAVTVLAVNGGPIARMEFRIAVALGARVGVVAGSGREADALLEDPDWCWAPNLIRLTPDTAAIRHFLEPA